MKRVVFNNEDEEKEYREGVEAKKRPRDASLLKKRRERIREIVPPNGAQLYEYLSQRSNNRKWRYLCMIQNGNTQNNRLQVQVWGWSLQPKFMHNFSPERHDEACEEAQMMRDLGVGKMYFARPWFALVEPNGIMVARLALGEKLVFVYDVHRNNVILDYRKKTD